MSTRSVIATPLDNGFTGRYIHMDGYPTHMVPTLLDLVEEKGLDWVAQTIVVDHVSWSSVSSPAGEGLPGNPHTDVEDEDGWRYTQADFTEGGGGIEWVYILNARELSVMEPTSDGLVYVGGFTWGSEPTEKELVAAECGADFERCSHYGWAHAEALGVTREQIGDMSARQWLGHVALGLSSSTYAVDRWGRGHEISRSGSSGSATSHRDYQAKTHYWWGYTTSNTPIRLARVLKGGEYKLDVDLFMPATAVAEAYVMPRGTLISRY